MPFDEPGVINKGAKVTHVGSYKLLHVLGKGAFCKVKLATHIVSGQQFAAKIIKPVQNLKWTDVEREIAVLRKLDHPNIIKLQQVIYLDENKVAHAYVHHGPRASWPPRKLYMIMELAEGGELFDYIINQTYLAEDEARRLFRQILGGLEYMHAHLVVHRDLKPENIVLDSKRNIKINDFGLSCNITPGASLKNFCGSPVYAAPEILRKKKYDGATADIWSLGVMLFTMVTGHLPWKPSNSNPENYFNMLQGRFHVPRKVKLSQECHEIMKRMLNPEPKKRATIKELKNHPWTNEGFADRPHAFHHSYPPVPLDNSIVKKMVQMGYTTKEVQAIVMNNQTSPILTTYHTIRNLSLEVVPSFSLLDPSLSLSSLIPDTSPAPALSLSSPTYKTSQSVEIKNTGSNQKSPSTPPLLRLARDLPPQNNDNENKNNQYDDNGNNDIESPRDLLSSSPLQFSSSPPLSTTETFVEYRAHPEESDFFSSSPPPLPTSYSLPSQSQSHSLASSPLSGSLINPPFAPTSKEIHPQKEMLSSSRSPSPSLPLSPLLTFEFDNDEGRDRRSRAVSVGSWSDDISPLSPSIDDHHPNLKQSVSSPVIAITTNKGQEERRERKERRDNNNKTEEDEDQILIIDNNGHSHSGESKSVPSTPVGTTKSVDSPPRVEFAPFSAPGASKSGNKFLKLFSKLVSRK